MYLIKGILNLRISYIAGLDRSIDGITASFGFPSDGFDHTAGKDYPLLEPYRDSEVVLPYSVFVA